MKIAGLIIGILLMVLSGIGFVSCLILPGMNSHVSIQESMMVAIPLAGLFFVALVGTISAAIFVFKARGKAANQK
ncbi:MAG: hypothetical protein ACR2HG_01120 [Pyrinomonadaceae bacterium]